MDALFLLAEIDPSDPAQNPIAKYANLGILVNLLTPLLISAAALIFGAMLLYMAFTYITAGGDPEKVAKAQQIGIYSVIGIVVVFLAYLLVKIVGFVLGVDIPI